tara:strand:+ start:25 stop:177 length:153 start_codon:yes stop_codon:yes gene_type:complete
MKFEKAQASLIFLIELAIMLKRGLRESPLFARPPYDPQIGNLYGYPFLLI